MGWGTGKDGYEDTPSSIFLLSQTVRTGLTEHRWLLRPPTEPLGPPLLYLLRLGLLLAPQ